MMTPEEKYKKVVDAGLDPTKYTFVEDGATEGGDNIPTVESFNPYDVIRGGPIPEEQPPPAPKTSLPGSILSGAAQSLIPTAASLGGVRLGLQIPGPPIVKGIGALAGGLGAGALANYGQGKLLQKILPQNVQDTMAQQQEEHPYGSLIGEVLPGFGVASPGGIFGELGKVFQPSTISKVKVGQALLGAGLQGGMEGIREYQEGKGFDPIKLGIATAAGGLQNEPTTLGRKILGLPAVNIPEVETYVEPPKPIIPKSATESTVQPEGILNALNQQEGIEQLRQELQDKEVVPSLETDQSEVVKSGDIPNRPQTEEEFTPDSTEKYYQEEEAIRRKVPAPGIGNRISGTEPIISLHDEGDFRTLQDREHIRKGQQFVKYGPQYDEYGKRILSEAGPGQPLTEEGITRAAELAQRRGTKLEKQVGIPGKTTPEARGYYDPEENVVRVNPNTATEDTGLHEVGHKYFGDLEQSTRELDPQHYQAGLDDPRVIQLAKERDITLNEALTELTGKRAAEVERHPIKSYLEDSGKYIGEKLGLTKEDPINRLSRRLRDDRPYNESPELQKLTEQVNKFYSEVPASQGGNNTDKKTAITSKAGTSEFSLGPLKPVVDRIREFSPVAAKAVENTEIENRQLNGKITNSFVENAGKIKDKVNAVKYIWESRYGNAATVPLNPRDKALIDGPINKTYRLVHEEQRANGPSINGRQAIDNPNLKGPNIIDHAVMDRLLNKPSTDAKRQALINDFINHQVKYFDVTPAEAKENFNSLIRGFSPGSEKSNTAAFNALRKAEGFGIPWSWMEKDPVKLFQRYGNRVARDLAYYRNIENNPEVSALFGHTKQLGVEPIVNNSINVAQRRLTGTHTTSETTYNAIEHFVRSLILGPATGVKNTISTLGQILPYVSIRDLPKIAEAFGQIRRGFKDSMDLGVNRHSITSLETGDIGGGLGRFSENLKALGDIIRKYSGSNAIEQWTRAHNMALGEILTESYWGRAAKGDINARKFLQQFAPDGTNLNFRNLGSLPESVKLETAARFVERVQGTYGLRGLPSFLLEPTSPAFWFMSLAKWSTEKANVITKDVINPAMKGDVGPLLRYALGGMFTGEAIRAIGEELMGKKVNTPNLKETADKGDWSDYVYKVFELSSLAGLGGLYSDLAKMAGDIGKGYSTRGYNIPSAELVKDITTEIGNASQAISEGQKPADVIMSLLTNLITDNIQAIRMVSNQLHPEEMARADRFRDKRIYDKLEGKNIPAPEGRTDRYGSMAEREFKRTKNLSEAKNIYKQDIEPKLKTLPREDRIKSMSGLRRNSYQTVPADRREAEKYYQYIRRTQGVDAMVRLKKDKEQQDRVNREKSRLVR